MDQVSFRFPTDIRFGPGACGALAELAERQRPKRPLLVTDQGMLQTEAYRMVAAELDRIWPGGWTEFSGIQPNPVEADIASAYEAYHSSSSDAIIGFGGGSALDGAKALVLAVAFPSKPLDEIALERLSDQVVPLCAIPTTAGTGSEVGWSSVITLASHGRKAVLSANALMPSLAILDPELTVGLPPHLTAATGMDAMTHAIEAFVCPMFHPLCDGIALEAIYRINRFLPRAVSDGSDIEARGQMQVAAAMGAIAFQKDLGAAHSLAHPLSSELGAHHGLSNAIVLPAVVRFNGEQHGELYRRVAIALGMQPDDDPSEQVAHYLESLTQAIGITQRLHDLGVTEQALPGLAQKAYADGCHLSNPRPCTEAQLLELYRQCL